jgi:hypothetical protein
MVKILVSQSLVEIESLKTRLEQIGIACFVKNLYASGLAGEVPFAEVFPELWLVNDEDFQRAEDMMQRWRAESGASGPKWVCASCGERHGQQFTACWNCGAPRR